MKNLERLYVPLLAFVMAFITFVETKIFHIPAKHETAIWTGNILLVIFSYLYAVNNTKKEYEEKLSYV